jgi:hypothetical protein
MAMDAELNPLNSRAIKKIEKAARWIAMKESWPL